MAIVKDQVLNIVQYMLVADQKKLPIKKADIIKCVIPTESKALPIFMEKVKEYLESVFGLIVCEIPDKNCYILVSKIVRGINWPESNGSSHCADGILIMILALIFMSGGDLKEEDLWSFLRKFDLEQETKLPLNGETLTLKQVLNSLWLRQLYLSREVTNSENREAIFSWGYRAEKEVSKKELLAWVCEIYGEGCTPSSWKSQYQLAQEQERERPEQE